MPLKRWLERWRAEPGARAAVTVGLLVIVAVYLAQVALYWHYVNDDAFITFRYSRLLAGGQGPWYNPGEHVEGYTNFLLMLILAGPIRIFGPESAVSVAKVIGALGGLAGILCAFGIARLVLVAYGFPRVGAALAAVAAAGIPAFHPGYALNSTSGLETTLFAALLGAGVLLSLRTLRDGRWHAAGLCLGAAILTRPEGIYLAGVLILTAGGSAALRLPRAASSPEETERESSVLGRVRPLLVDAAIVAAFFTTHLAIRMLLYDGEVVPNTYFAKSGTSDLPDPWAYVRTGLGPTFLGYAGLGAAVVGLAFARRIARLLVPLCLVALAGATLPLLAGSDWMLGWRLLVPYFPLLGAAVVVGWAVGLAKVIRRSVVVAAAIPLLWLPALWFVQDARRDRYEAHIRVRARGFETGHRALARWLCRGRAQPGDTLALMDIGIIGYTCIEQRILDLTGLTDRHIAKSPGGFLDKRYRVRYVLDRAPRFVILTLWGPRGSGSSAKLPPPAQLRFWTPIERRIAADAGFRAAYLRRAHRTPAGELQRLAARIGAVRVFPHAHPKVHYLLAVFEKRQARTR